MAVIGNVQSFRRVGIGKKGGNYKIERKSEFGVKKHKTGQWDVGEVG